MPPRGQSVFRVHQIFGWRSNSPRPGVTAGDTTNNGDDSRHSEAEGEEEDQPQLSVWGALLLLVGATVIAGTNAGFLVRLSCFELRTKANQGGRVTLSQVSSIRGVIAAGQINEKFIALILLPIIGNAAGQVCRKLHINQSYGSCVSFPDRSHHGVA